MSTKAGLVDADEYELIVEGNTFTFTFKNEMKTAFILEYKSYINADSGERIGNKVEFAGQSSSVMGSDHQTGIRVSMAGAGGGASTGGGKIKIYKVDDTGLPLEGAIFAIYNASGTTLLETLKPTDINGEVETSRKYRFNDQTNGLPYKLKEVSAPNGYLIDPEYGASTGKTIEFKDPDQPFEIKNEKIRQGFELTKMDSVDSSKTLKGATFELYLKNGPSQDKIAELTTGDDGRIAKGDLEPGDYELIETEAPAYYQLDATPVTFTIAANQTQILTLSHTNVQGSGGKLAVTKVNAKDQSVLSGIEFELRDSNANVIAKKVTDLNGVIEFESLPYGPYTLVETKAEGFVIEQPETAISITKPETQLTIENKENDRSVKLIKYNSGKSQHLQGAVFELHAQSALMDANGDWEFKMVTGIDETKLTTNSNGEMVLKDLEPNKYQLVEIKAPAGYKLDKTPVEFEITDKQTETVVVEKTNIAIPVLGGPSEPYNPGTPNPGTPNPGTSTPDPSTPGTTVPGTVVTPETSEPEDGTDQGTEPNAGESPSIPGDSTVDEEGPSDVANAGDATSPGADHTSSPADTNVAGAEEGKDGSFLGMLPKTGEESTLGYTVVGTLMIILGSVGYLYFRRRQQMNS